jgi:hypothetical protein
MKQPTFVIQKLVKSHQIKPDGRLGTWRTVTEPKCEEEAVRLLHRLPHRSGVFRALNSPSISEMTMHTEVTEWVI